MLGRHWIDDGHAHCLRKSVAPANSAPMRYPIPAQMASETTRHSISHWKGTPNLPKNRSRWQQVHKIPTRSKSPTPLTPRQSAICSWLFVAKKVLPDNGKIWELDLANPKQVWWCRFFSWTVICKSDTQRTQVIWESLERNGRCPWIPYESSADQTEEGTSPTGGHEMRPETHFDHIGLKVDGPCLQSV